MILSMLDTSQIVKHLMCCGHTMLLTAVILLPLMESVVTTFCSTYSVSVCPLRYLLNFGAYITPCRQHVEIYDVYLFTNKIYLISRSDKVVMLWVKGES
jgi:hypothetical protein